MGMLLTVAMRHRRNGYRRFTVIPRGERTLELWTMVLEATADNLLILFFAVVSGNVRHAMTILYEL
jgi:hypothetical protein